MSRSRHRYACGARQLALATALALAATACARRPTAYRFRAPLVDGIAAPEVPPPSVADRLERARTPAGAPARRHARARRAPAAAPKAPPASPLVARLRSFVGKRDSDATSVQLALTAVATLGLHLPAALRKVDDGPTLVERARAARALSRRDPLLGDLVVFDDLQGRGPACLVGVVVGARDDGTVEFIYLGLGVVRRGYLNLRHPTTGRDRAGRALNTWLRIARGHYRKGRAGDRWSTFIRSGRLASARPGVAAR